VACSYREVDWRARGATSGKLAHILGDLCGEFYDAHRAILDCYVGLHVLAASHRNERPAFAELLDSVRRATMRVWAIDSLSRVTWSSPGFGQQVVDAAAFFVVAAPDINRPEMAIFGLSVPTDRHLVLLVAKANRHPP